MRHGPAVVAALLFLAAEPARAEIALLANGQTMKLSGHRPEGESVVLSLRGGGEVTVPAAFLRGVVPDEILDEVGRLPLDADPSDVRALAVAAARRHGLDPDLVLAVVAVESGFRKDAVSPKGARGLMQLMPGTAESLGVRDAFDPEENLDGGSRYLRWLVGLYGGDLEKALAAYNAGPGAVKRHNGVPPYRETRGYVRKVLEEYRASAEAGEKPRSPETGEPAERPRP